MTLAGVTLCAVTFCAVTLGACTSNGAAAPRPGAAVAPSSAPALPSLPSRRATVPRGPIVGEYTARWDPVAGEVGVEARFSALAGGVFAVERGADAFARDVEMAPDRDGAPWSPVVRRGREIRAAACAAGPCRLRYRFALREAARRLDDLDVASEEGEVVEAPPSTWLLVPAASRELRVRFRVTCPEGARFVTGVFPSTEAPGAWDITIDDLWTSPYTAFGPLRVRTVPVKGGAIEVAIAPGNTLVSDDELAAWVESSARALTAYYDHFPVPSALVMLVVARGRWVGSGRTLAGGGGTVFVRIGERAPTPAFRDDWVLVHELVHLTFPSEPREQSWAEEGVATYVEPFARVRAGLLSEADAWAGLVHGLPKGLPRADDRGLDHTPTWGRTYWGGALFWFLADVEIRKRTQNQRGLEDALRGIVDSGGNNAMRWPLADVLAEGDRATGVPVLSELHAAMGSSPHPVELDPLFASLGVTLVGGRIQLDDHAPLAAIRRSIAHGKADTLPSP